MYKAKNILKQFLCFFDRILSKTDLFFFYEYSKAPERNFKETLPDAL